MLVKDLQIELGKRGLNTKGKKSELAERLRACLAEPSVTGDVAAATSSAAAAASATTSSNSADENATSAKRCADDAIDTEPANKRSKILSVNVDESRHKHEAAASGVSPETSSTAATAQVDDDDDDAEDYGSADVAPVVTAAPQNILHSASPASAVAETSASSSSSSSSSSASSSSVVRVDNFVRPFSQADANALFATHGTVIEVWFDSKKSSAVITYDSSVSAACAAAALHDQRWPTFSPKTLTASVITAAEAAAHKSSTTGTAVKPTLSVSSVHVHRVLSSASLSRVSQNSASTSTSASSTAPASSNATTTMSISGVRTGGAVGMLSNAVKAAVSDASASSEWLRAREADRAKRLEELTREKEANEKRRADVKAQQEAAARAKYQSAKAQMRTQFSLTSAQPQIFYRPRTDAQAALRGEVLQREIAALAQQRQDERRRRSPSSSRSRSYSRSRSHSPPRHRK